jgi:hypothetical protein
MTPFTRAVFVCDGRSVFVTFVCEDQPAGEPHVFSREEAVTRGREIAETGIYDRFPIAGVSLDAVRAFGARLEKYGLTGS